MIINITDLKKKIIYRSNYRGTKEMDKLLGSFTKRYINTFCESELLLLKDLLSYDDQSLYKFNQGLDTSVKFENNKINKLFKNYIYKKE
tara:strand:- start:31 stop:297 length:267 start_codon:yes stop_codon:yes gene_type:complete